MRRLDIVAFTALILIVVIGQFVGFADSVDRSPGADVRRPDPGRFADPPTAENALPPISGREPTLAIDLPPAGPGSGTAFSVDSSGRWLTARHVIDGCRRVLLQTGPRRGIAVRNIRFGENSDLAVLTTNGGRPSLPAARKALSRGQNGFLMGFPQGNPGDVHGRLLGRMNLRISGRYATHEPVIAWAEIQRRPAIEGHLGGISGGPVLDAAGNVIGVVVAGAPRRGRSYSAAPISLERTLSAANVTPGVAPPANFMDLNPQRFDRVGASLRRDLTIAKVHCQHDRRRRTPRRPGV